MKDGKCFNKELRQQKKPPLCCPPHSWLVNVRIPLLPTIIWTQIQKLLNSFTFGSKLIKSMLLGTTRDRQLLERFPITRRWTCRSALSQSMHTHGRCQNGPQVSSTLYGKINKENFGFGWSFYLGPAFCFYIPSSSNLFWHFTKSTGHTK